MTHHRLQPRVDSSASAKAGRRRNHAAGPGILAQSDLTAIQGVLADAGFADVRTEPHTLPLRFGTTVADPVDYLADSGPGRAILETISPDRHDDLRAVISDALRAHHTPEHGVMLDAAVLLTTARTQP